MPGEIDMPGVGPVNKKVLIVSGVVAAAVLTVLYLRHRNTTAATPSDTGDTADTGTDSASGGGGTAGGSAGTGPVSTDAITTNAQWTAHVMESLAGIVDTTLLSRVLGKYITGKPVTPDEGSIIDQAIAIAGYPPVHGVNDHPPAVYQQQSPGQTQPPPPPSPNPTAAKRRYVMTLKYPSNPAWRGTLSGIASHTNRSVVQLQAWNGIANPNVIEANKRIWVDPPGTYSGSIEIK